MKDQKLTYEFSFLDLCCEPGTYPELKTRCHFTFSLKGFESYIASTIEGPRNRNMFYLDMVKRIRRTRAEETRINSCDFPEIIYHILAYYNLDVDEENRMCNNHPSTVHCVECEETYPRRDVEIKIEEEYLGPTNASNDTVAYCPRGHMLAWFNNLVS